MCDYLLSWYTVQFTQWWLVAIILQPFVPVRHTSLCPLIGVPLPYAALPLSSSTYLDLPVLAIDAIIIMLLTLILPLRSRDRQLSLFWIATSVVFSSITAISAYLQGGASIAIALALTAGVLDSISLLIVIRRPRYEW